MLNKMLITTPRGALYQHKTKGGEVKVRLEWSADFGRRKTGDFSRAQRFVDNEVLRFCSARVPFDTGMLQKSASLVQSSAAARCGISPRTRQSSITAPRPPEAMTLCAAACGLSAARPWSGSGYCAGRG